jgi:hypothetical protein
MLSLKRIGSDHNGPQPLEVALTVKVSSSMAPEDGSKNKYTSRVGGSKGVCVGPRQSELKAFCSEAVGF